MISNKSKGYIHEEKAGKFLEESGFLILQKNYFASFGEIDLIVKKDKMIVFVEVKYRKNSNYGYGSEAIDRNKSRRIYFSAMEYLRKYKYQDYMVRFDAIIFLGEKMEWIENVLWGDEIGF
ncbi:MAG: YraN family protein [Cetobacterium sp.]|uniref:YraN family protein n=1 Tax=unclassified Cetobacterium TaxID=2630983 RepID=UPI001C8D97E2|nr:YraN family protein [Cetobacterium sp. 2A]